MVFGERRVDEEVEVVKTVTSKLEAEVFRTVKAKEYNTVVLTIYTEASGMGAHIDIGSLLGAVIGDADYDGLRHVELCKGCLLRAARIHMASQHGNRRPHVIT